MAELDRPFSSSALDQIPVEVEMLDFAYVEACPDWQKLFRIAQVLRSGKEGFYPELLRRTEEKMLEVMPSKEKKKYLALNSTASPTEVANAESEIFKWQQITVEIDERLKTNSARASQDLLSMENASSALSTYSSPFKEHLSKSQIAKLSEARVLAKYDSLSFFQRERRAELERRKGNEYFKSSDYDLAVKHYTISIALRDDQDSIWANRAIAYIKLKLFDLAETDCNIALRINPSNLKALQRRGFTRFNLGRYRDAAMDYASAIELDGGVSEDYRAILQKALDKYEETEGRPLDLAAVLSSSLAPAPSQPIMNQSKSIATTRQTFGSSNIEAGWISYSTSTVISSEQLAIPKESVKLMSKGIITAVAKPAPPVVEKETFVQIPIQFDDEDDDEDEEKEPMEESKKGDEGFIRIPIVTDDDDDDDEEDYELSHSQLKPTQYREVEAAAGISTKTPAEQAANILKEHGNQLMIKGNYQEALVSYSASLARLPGNVAVLNNRAQAKLTLRDFQGAVEDSTAVLQTEPGNVKALFRRAKARSEIKEWLAAADDLKAILAKDSTNSAAKKLLAELEPQLRSTEAERLKNDGNAASHANDFKQAMTLYTEALRLDEHNLAARSNRSLAHLKIQDFAAAEADASDVLRRLASSTSSEMNSIRNKALYRRAEARYQLALQSGVNGKLAINEKEILLKQALDDLRDLTAFDPSNKFAPVLHGLVIAALAESQERKTVKKTVPSAANVKNESAAVIPLSAPLSTKSSESESMLSAVKTTRKASAAGNTASVVVSPEKAVKGFPPSPPPETQPRSAEKQPSSALKSEKSFKNLTAAVTELPSAPAKTLYEFERVWRGLLGQPALQLGYLNMFKAANFKKVFKAAISDDLLGSLFTSLTQPSAQPALVLRVLESLKQMNSFSLTISMLPSEHLQELGRVLDSTKARVSEAEMMDRLKQLEVDYGLRK